MSVEKQLHHLWNYKWSSLPGYIALAGRRDFIEYGSVLGEYAGDSRGGRLRYRKQLTEDLTAGVTIKE